MTSSPPVRAAALLIVALSAACAEEAPPAARPAAEFASLAPATDGDLQQVLDAHAELGPRPLEKLSARKARLEPGIADAVDELLKDEGRAADPAALVPGVTTRETEVDGAAGKLPATIYTPAGSGNFPVVLYFHGGGWVVADRKAYDAGARGLSNAARAIVISVDYRRAPEHKFPAAHDDALAAYQWVTDNATAFGGDPKRVALAGESAGGNLALATAIAARDGKLQMPMHVLAVYPIAQSDTNTESYRQYATARPLNRAAMLWFFGHYTRGAADLKDPRIDLAQARLQNLPPVTLINASVDPLLSDGQIIEAKLREAGVPVERRVYEGMTHEFFGTAAVVRKAQEAQLYAGARLAQTFGDPSKGPKPAPPAN